MDLLIRESGLESKMEVSTPHLDFSPAVKTISAQKLTRPSLSYWEDAWIRLQKNRQAIVSLGLIIFLVLFTMLGPLIWRVDPTAQDLNRISEGASIGDTALVVEKVPFENIVNPQVPEAPEKDNPQIKAPMTVELNGPASTLAVQVKWSAVQGAAGYSVYRSDFEPKTMDELGMAIEEVSVGNQLSIIDQLKLRDQTYWYSVVSKSVETTSSDFTTLKVDVSRGISLEESELSQPGVRPGQTVKLVNHPLGTDYLGRDMLARLMSGGRISLFIGIIAPLLFILLGTLYGGAAGYLGGRWDNYMMRVADLITSFPFLLIMIILYVVFNANGEKSVFVILLAMVSLFWPSTARLVRGQVLQLREEGYVQAAKLLGVRTSYLIVRHLVPNTMGVILVTLTFAVPSSIFTEAFLSFIGMGVKPPVASWGSLCEEGVRTMSTSPHELFWPALFIAITALSFNLLGDGLRDALDAKMRSRE